jgi:regulator of sigma E protease
MHTAFSFLLAIVILVAVHECGHFLTAIAFRVKVLRFSIGFGPQLVAWRSTRLGTEFAVCLLPLGGYVKFLDERDGLVSAQDRPFAFNVQPIKVRAAIVAGGPVANFLLAIVLYAGLNWYGLEQAKPLLSAPAQNSLAAAAGIRGGELVLTVRGDGQDATTVASFEDFRWLLTQSALSHQDLSLGLADSSGVHIRDVVLPLSQLSALEAGPEMFRAIGIQTPLSFARLGALSAGAAAEQAGLKSGDLVLQVDATPIADAGQLYELILKSVRPGDAERTQTWRVERSGAVLVLQVTPRVEQWKGAAIGRIGAYIGTPPAMTIVRYGLWDGVSRAVLRTWEVSELSLKMMWKILIGDASLKNLSGPISIAKYAGQSASMGAPSFVLFLALISVSLGVLNLLPVPVLDGGHLMYYLWETLTGKPVSESWMEQFQKIGLLVLLMLMSVAVFNDVSRPLG